MSNTPSAQTEKVFDITIIGGGPTGLFAAFYCGMRDATCKIIDSLPELGGQLATLYPEKYIYDVGGFPKIKARTLVEQLKEQAFQYNPAVHLNERVEHLRRREDGIIELVTDKGTHYSRAVIICAGIGAFTPKELPAQSAKQFVGKGVYYFIDDLEKFRGKRALVIGGGDTAVDFALMLESVAAKVTLIHRRDQFRAHEDSVKQLFNSSVEVKTFVELHEVHGGDWVERATLIHNKTKETFDIEVDAIVSGLGFSASLGPIANWGLQIEGNEIVVNTKMETNIPGVYAAGDIVTYPGKVKLIATGLGEAPTAVNNAKTYIDPKARLFPGHSSNRKE
ncbi:ferredoxin--NADP reductase [Alicyclobacillus cellulosilyticus]|uniref:Ferredoxin--NADP reductase n=1 Tax=Alicyclobacillus cellulosilyticus TaxID=1003997 RepID=A0A917K286_9BACL|nr:NAD(P)/FAD-dependent oxidoreductase [Alicyclobacillus cellulosilyticus]GGI95874.1 ferredoxin--NADP reductase [Alicyclobacillus cellulosilyticus]